MADSFEAHYEKFRKGVSKIAPDLRFIEVDELTEEQRNPGQPSEHIQTLWDAEWDQWEKAKEEIRAKRDLLPKKGKLLRKRVKEIDALIKKTQVLIDQVEEGHIKEGLMQRLDALRKDENRLRMFQV